MGRVHDLSFVDIHPHECVDRVAEFVPELQGAGS